MSTANPNEFLSRYDPEELVLRGILKGKTRELNHTSVEPLLKLMEEAGVSRLEYPEIGWFLDTSGSFRNPRSLEEKEGRIADLIKRGNVFNQQNPTINPFYVGKTRRGPKQPTASQVGVRPRTYYSSDFVPLSGDRKFQSSEYDSLNAKVEAKILATLLVAKESQPPFALALLGDWGIGKTFFMRLMLETVGKVAGNGVSMNRTDSVSRVAQIEFNAWHYVDSDLWASLASRIFDGLSKELSEKTNKFEEVRRRLRRRIRSSELDIEAARHAVTTATAARRVASNALKEMELKRSKSESERESYRLKRIWKAVFEEESGPEQEKPKNIANNSDLKDEVEKFAKNLGITTAIDNVKELRRVYKAMRSLSHKSGGLPAALASAFKGKRAFKSASLVLLVLLLAAAVPWLTGAIGSWKPILDNLPSQSWILQLATILFPAIVWAAKNLNSFSSAICDLEKIHDELRKPFPEPDTESAEGKCIRKIEKLETEIAAEQGKIDEADRHIAEAQAEIQRIDAGGLVYDFLEGRVQDSRYLDRLGLISVIRQDFEELGSLLNDWNQSERNGDGGSVMAGDDSPKDQPIQRIVLYIDDLDRCPPKRVVEVLQAVHLILAFDLFSVVVAVDARWLERSLNEIYNPVTEAEPGNLRKAPVHAFSAHNYLEKIFQIPFQLQPLDEEGYKRLVSDLSNEPSKIADRKKVKSNKAQDEGGSEKPNHPEGSGHGNDDLEEAGEQEQEETDKRIQAMLLGEHEKSFIEALFPFIDRPRLAKRFVNIYRLLRVRAATLSESEFSTFNDPQSGAYRAVLLLLAINIGRPEVAAKIIGELPNAQGRSFLEFLEEMAQSNTQKETGTNSGARIHARSGEKVRNSLLEIRKSIDTVNQALEKMNVPFVDDRLFIYQKWALEVGRYSFQWHLNDNA